MVRIDWATWKRNKFGDIVNNVLFKKKPKYRNKKTEQDGIIFHSKKESDRYSELKLLYMAGEITGLKLQPVYALIPAIKKHREIKYKADFEYTEKDGTLIVEDVKGCKTEVYKIKKKLFARKYGFDITET